MENTNNEAAPQVSAPVVDKKQKTSKAPLLCSVLFGALAIAGAGFGVYSYLDSNKKNDEIKDLKAQINALNSTNKTEDENADIEDEIKDLIDSFKTTFEKTVKTTVVDSESAPVIKAGDLKVQTALEKFYGFETEDFDIEFDDIDEALENIAGKLKENGYAEISSFWGPSYYNEDKGIICHLSGGKPASVTCGYEGWISDETVEFVNELADAYKEKAGEYPKSLLVNNATIKDSEVEPYQVLEGVRFENAAALFYRVDEDSDWQFFVGTQAPLMCSSYNTEDLKNAYAGTTCLLNDYSSDPVEQLSTVQP